MTAPRPTLADADPLPLVIAALEADPDLGAAFQAVDLAFGGPGGGVRVVGVVGPPYPCLRIVPTPGGTLNDMRWRISPELAIEVWGDTDGRPGAEALQRLLTLALVAVKRLEEHDYQPWEPVVTHVDASVPFPLDDPTGQARWMSTATVICHPPISPKPWTPLGD